MFDSCPFMAVGHVDCGFLFATPGQVVPPVRMTFPENVKTQSQRKPISQRYMLGEGLELGASPLQAGNSAFNYWLMSAGTWGG